MIKTQSDVYVLHRQEGKEFLTFRSFDRYEKNLAHLFTMRRGGVSSGCLDSWNFGAHDLDTAENILRNYEILAETLEVPANSMVRSAQTHTTNIKVVTEDDCGKGITRERDYTDVDGLVTDVRGIPIITGHADCNAVFFYDPVKYVIGLAHSGWKGTLAGISGEMVKMMGETYGCRAADLVVGLGPALCQACFEVDADVAEKFFAANEAYRDFAYNKILTGSYDDSSALERVHKYYIDLKGIIKYDLSACGVSASQISDMELCTKCNKDMFFSHRGHKGKRGIMAAVMMLK